MTANTNPTPGLPKTTGEVSTTLAIYPSETSSTIRYILYFFKGSPHSQFTFIDFPADWKLQQVVERVKQYCNTMGMRFIRIEPMMTDMAKNEKVYGDQ